MIIIKHKDLDITIEQILDALNTRTIPKGIIFDISKDTITVSPEGKGNILGLITPEYETIYDDFKS